MIQSLPVHFTRQESHLEWFFLGLCFCQGKHKGNREQRCKLLGAMGHQGLWSKRQFILRVTMSMRTRN